MFVLLLISVTCKTKSLLPISGPPCIKLLGPVFYSFCLARYRCENDTLTPFGDLSHAAEAARFLSLHARKDPREQPSGNSPTCRLWLHGILHGSRTLSNLKPEIPKISSFENSLKFEKAAVHAKCELDLPFSRRYRMRTNSKR